MKIKATFIKRLIFNLLPFEYYLRVLSKLYFISFDMGLLQRNKHYDYQYFLEEIISKGDVCIDIGANLGYVTVPLSKLVGSKGKVFAVEPIKPILSVLKSNTKRTKNVEIYPFALGAENKKIKLGNNTKKQKGFIASGSSYILDYNSESDNTAEVEFDAEMKKGSELFGNLSKLDFIKCDIEGYELIVILDLEPVILKFRPILLIETVNESRVKLLDFFKTHKYEGFVLDNGKLTPARKDDYWDILFVPNSKLGEISKYLAEETNNKNKRY